MKIVTCCIIVMSMMSFGKSNTLDLGTDKGKIAFVEQFLDKIESEEEFSLEDDYRFFKTHEIARYLLLNQLGYVDESGILIGEEPKVSYGGRLVKLHKHLFSRKGYRKNCEAVVYRGLYDVILVYQKEGSSVDGFLEEDCYKVFVFSLAVGSKNQGFIDLIESSINGKPMLYLLGFKYPDGLSEEERKSQEPRLSEEVINKIK